jgi:hypothetical protein
LTRADFVRRSSQKFLTDNIGAFLPPVPHLPQTLIDPLARVALFLREGFVFFDDLSDPLKVGANLRLGAGLLQTITRGLRMGQYLL